MKYRRYWFSLIFRRSIHPSTPDECHCNMGFWESSRIFLRSYFISFIVCTVHFPRYFLQIWNCSWSDISLSKALNIITSVEYFSFFAKISSINENTFCNSASFCWIVIFSMYDVKTSPYTTWLPGSSPSYQSTSSWYSLSNSGNLAISNWFNCFISINPLLILMLILNHLINLLLFLNQHYLNFVLLLYFLNF